MQTAKGFSTSDGVRHLVTMVSEEEQDKDRKRLQGRIAAWLDMLSELNTYWHAHNNTSPHIPTPESIKLSYTHTHTHTQPNH